MIRKIQRSFRRYLPQFLLLLLESRLLQNTELLIFTYFLFFLCPFPLTTLHSLLTTHPTNFLLLFLPLLDTFRRFRLLHTQIQHLSLILLFLFFFIEEIFEFLEFLRGVQVFFFCCYFLGLSQTFEVGWGYLGRSRDESAWLDIGVRLVLVLLGWRRLLEELLLM